MLEIRSILAPTDFSHHAEAALRYACALAERFGSTLHLLHVLPEANVPMGPDPMLSTVPGPEFYRDSEAASMEALSRALDPSWGQPARVETAFRWGDMVDAIVGYAASNAIELVVVATHGRTGFSHALLGSFAERIVRESPCPVLTIRNSEVG